MFLLKIEKTGDISILITESFIHNQRPRIDDKNGQFFFGIDINIVFSWNGSLEK